LQTLPAIAANRADDVSALAGNADAPDRSSKQLSHTLGDLSDDIAGKLIPLLAGVV